MPQFDIPRDNWRKELDGFSRQHDGWIVRVEVTDPYGRKHTEVADLPLRGVSLDSPDASRVAIMAAPGEGFDHVTHEVMNPVGIGIDRTDSGAVRGLSIRSTDGSATTVEFRSPAVPAEVDGMPR